MLSDSASPYYHEFFFVIPANDKAGFMGQPGIKKSACEFFCDIAGGKTILIK